METLGISALTWTLVSISVINIGLDTAWCPTCLMPHDVSCTKELGLRLTQVSDWHEGEPVPRCLQHWDVTDFSRLLQVGTTMCPNRKRYVTNAECRKPLSVLRVNSYDFKIQKSFLLIKYTALKHTCSFSRSCCLFNLTGHMRVLTLRF